MRTGLRIVSVVMIVAAVAYAVASGLMFARSGLIDIAGLMVNTPNALLTGEDAAWVFGWAFAALAVVLAASGALGLVASTGECKTLLTVFQAVTWVTMIVELLQILFNVLAVRTDNLLLLIATAAIFGIGADLAQRVKREIRIAEGRRYKGHPHGANRTQPPTNSQAGRKNGRKSGKKNGQQGRKTK